MIDIRKALSQRCYIVFDTNEQLLQFIASNNLDTYVGISEHDKVISIHPLADYITLIEPLTKTIPRYHHTELTITDDGE